MSGEAGLPAAGGGALHCLDREHCSGSGSGAVRRARAKAGAAGRGRARQGRGRQPGPASDRPSHRVAWWHGRTGGTRRCVARVPATGARQRQVDMRCRLCPPAPCGAAAAPLGARRRRRHDGAGGPTAGGGRSTATGIWTVSPGEAVGPRGARSAAPRWLSHRRGRAGGLPHPVRNARYPTAGGSPVAPRRRRASSRLLELRSSSRRCLCRGRRRPPQGRHSS